SDAGDAKVLAEVVRTDRHNHRPVAGDTELAEAIKVLARSHHRLIWSRRRQLNVLRAQLREYYPGALEAFGTDLAHPDAVSVLLRAPTPELGRALSRSAIRATLARGRRKRNLDARAEKIQQALRSPQIEAPSLVATAYGASVRAGLAVVGEMTRQIAAIEAQLDQSFESHPDAKILHSLPGLGVVLGARVLGEFGDDPNRYADAKSRKNYAGTSPITKASGKHRVVLARYARNRRLADACYLWAFASLTASPGARAFYDQRRAAGDTHHRALRALANRLVGVLHGCLRHRALYDEHTAWGHRLRSAA
ncbi:MAG: transposase, partial [Actinomycetes bacterium]